MAYIFVSPLYMAWLTVCVVMAIIGFLLPSKRVQLAQKKVEDSQTVCKVLNQKNLISESEYQFETEKVAAHYDELTFKGYLFVLGPLIFLLKSTSHFDSFVLFLVKRWMAVHRFLFFNEDKPRRLYLFLTHFCVGIAFRVGVLLFNLGRMSQLRVEL